MIVCGISIASDEATLVWIESSTLQTIAETRVSLANPYDKGDLDRTAELLRQLFVENKTERVVVRKSSVAGKYIAGHVVFRLETIITMSVFCELEFVSSQSVAAFIKREQIVFPKGLMVYQQLAYQTAASRSN